MTIARIAMFVLLAGVCVQMAFFYPKLAHAVVAAQQVPSARPGMMASHFNAAGEPNGQQTIMQFFETYGLIVILSTALFLGMPLLLNRMPNEYINLPNRDYWLAPSRRAKTMADINNRFNWLGVATLALVLVIMQTVLSVNLSANPELPGLAVWLPLGAYAAFGIWWGVRLFDAYARVPEGG
jgi:hypothetical protein